MNFGKFYPRQILLTILILYAVLGDKLEKLLRAHIFVLLVMLFQFYFTRQILYVFMLKLYLCYRKWKINKTKKQSPEVFYKKSISKNFAKFTGKHLCLSLFFNTVAVLRPATLLKKKVQQRLVAVISAKCSKSPFLQNNTGWLLLSTVLCHYSLPWCKF